MPAPSFLVLLLLAEVLGTVGGFGSSMLVMPLMGWYLPFDQALGLTAVFHVFSNAAKMLLFRKGMSWRLLLVMGVPAIIGVVIGARLTTSFGGSALELLLGAVLLALSVLLLLRPAWRLAPTDRNAATGGALSGLIAGLVGTGGAIRGFTLAAFDLEKAAFVSTSAWIDMGVDLSRTVVYAKQGYVGADTWAMLPWLAAVGLAGTWIGRYLLTFLSQQRFRRIALILVMAVGVATVLRIALASRA